MTRESREQRPRYDVYIKNEAHVEAIKEIWRSIDPSKFHVLADFDRTLTIGNVEGQRSPSVIAQVRNGTYLSDEYTAEAHRLFDEYHPIEVDESLPLEIRTNAMREWWKKHFELLMQSGLNQDVIRQIAKERPLSFREGTEELLHTLKQQGVPLVILSAAPGDMIEAYLAEQGLDDQHIHVVATRYDFDSTGQAIRIQEPIIHSLNKHEIAIQDHPAHDAVKDRKHVLLLGDSIGDVGMIEGFDYTSLLKVGFLNMNIAERKDAFMDAFDIVIAHDGPMTPVNELLADTVFRDS